MPSSSCGTSFQSTLPARGATFGSCHRLIAFSHFNPRSPHGERPAPCFAVFLCLDISIHAPRTGSDPSISVLIAARPLFQSTLPARGATQRFASSCVSCANFNPRSPHGERPPTCVRNLWRSTFQSTLPARGATPTGANTGFLSRYFNPRSPHGERR